MLEKSENQNQASTFNFKLIARQPVFVNITRMRKQKNVT